MNPMNLVKHILEGARRRLAVLGREASLCEAAGHLTDTDTPLVVVCDGDGGAVGVPADSLQSVQRLEQWISLEPEILPRKGELP
jgi:hypothetical protein